MYIFKLLYDIIVFMDSIDLFLSNVELLVKERNISKQAFCDALEFSRSSFVNWKKQSSIPNAETVIKIADYFNVDPKWLVTGSINMPEEMNSWPSEVFERVYNLLLQESNIPNPDYHQISVEQSLLIWKPVEPIVSCYDLINWQFNRIMPSYKQIFGLAEHFERPFTYIANGISEVPEYLNPCKVPADEYEDFKRFKEYKKFMYYYHNLYDPDQKMIYKEVKRLFRLRQKIEGCDCDFDYNQNHPLEKPREKDPNISDEEYEEMKKKES